MNTGEEGEEGEEGDEGKKGESSGDEKVDEEVGDTASEPE